MKEQVSLAFYRGGRTCKDVSSLLVIHAINEAAKYEYRNYVMSVKVHPFDTNHSMKHYITDCAK